MTAIAGWALMVFGATWMLLAAVGLHRMATPLSRLHVAGKAATLGVATLLLGAALVLRDPGGSTLLLLTAVVMFITTPAGAQALAAVVHRHGGDGRTAMSSTLEPWNDKSGLANEPASPGFTKD